MVNHQYCEYHSHVEATHYRIKVRTLNSIFVDLVRGLVFLQMFSLLKHCSKALLMMKNGVILCYTFIEEGSFNYKSSTIVILYPNYTTPTTQQKLRIITIHGFRKIPLKNSPDFPRRQYIAGPTQTCWNFDRTIPGYSWRFLVNLHWDTLEISPIKSW